MCKYYLVCSFHTFSVRYFDCYLIDMKPFAYDNVIDRNTSKPYVLAQQAQQQKRIPIFILQKTTFHMVGIIQKRIAVVRHVQTVAK